MKFSQGRQEIIESASLKNSSVADKIFAEKIYLLYKNLLFSVPASLLCATIVFVALYRIPHSKALLYWFASVISLSAMRIVMSLLYLRQPTSSPFSSFRFLLSTLMSAALWGYVGYALMPAQHVVEQMIVVIVLAGVSAGGLQSLQASFFTCCLYASTIIVPLSAWIFSQKDMSYLILGSATSLYLLFTIVIAWHSYQFLNKILQLKYKNIDLTENVSVTNHQLKEINQSLIEKENNLRLIHDNAPIGMAIVTLDGHWMNVNNRLCEIVGYNKVELEGLTIQELTYPEDLEVGSDNQAKLLSGKLNSYQMEKRYVTKNGQIIWILINVSLVRDKENKPFYFISQIQDINDRKQNEKTIASLNSMNEMLQLCHVSTEAYPIIARIAEQLFSGLGGGLSIRNKQTNDEETVGQWGETSLLKLIYDSDDCWALRSGNIYTVTDPKKDLLCQHFDTTPPGGYICLPLIVQTKVLGVLNFSAPAGQQITRYQQQIINNFSEIIKLSLANINLNEVLREQVIHDTLTGLFNRRYLNEYLPQMLQHVFITKSTLCVCMLDLDYFKNVNDQFGHDAGDEVLKFLGKLFKKNFREKDIACRFGGEEFVIVLMNVDLTQAIRRMGDVRNEVKNATIYHQDRLLPKITLSIGIAEAPRHGDNLKTLLRAADEALYAAKESGRDRVVTTQIVVEPTAGTTS